MFIMGTFDKHPHLLVNGSAISMVSGAGARAIGPAVSGWLYSISTQFRSGSIGRQIYWIVFLGFTLAPLLLSRQIPDDADASGATTDPDCGAETSDEAEPLLPRRECP